MMSDYDRTLELQEAAYNSVGQSTIQFNKYQDTVEYKINQIKNSWERLRVSLIDQNTYTKALDIGNQLLSSIKKDFSVKDLAFIGVIGLTIGKTFITNFISQLNKNVTNIQKTFSNIMNSSISAIEKSKIGVKLSNLINTSIKKNINFDSSIVTSLNTAINKATSQANSTTKMLQQQLNSELNIDSFTINPQSLIQFKTLVQQVGSISNVTSQDIQNLFQKMSNSSIPLTTEQANLLKNAFISLNQELNNIEINGENATNILERGVNQVTAEISKKEALLKNATNVFKSIGTSLGSALTMGITTAIATGDIENAIEAAGYTLLATAINSTIPAIITALTPTLISAGTSLGLLTGGAVSAGVEASTTLTTKGILAIVAVAAAVIGGVIALTSNFKTEVSTIDEQLKDLEKQRDDLEEQLSQNKSTAMSDRQELNNLEKLKEEYDELHNKMVLTSEEQERYAEITETIRNDFPEIVTYYNEVTGELRVQNELWEQIINKYREIAKESGEEFLDTQIELIRTEKQENDISLKKEQSEIDKIDLLEFTNEFQKRYSNISPHYGESTGNIIAPDMLELLEKNYNINDIVDKINTINTDTVITEEDIKNAINHADFTQLNNWSELLNDNFIEPMRSDTEDEHQQRMKNLDEEYKTNLKYYATLQGYTETEAQLIVGSIGETDLSNKENQNKYLNDIFKKYNYDIQLGEKDENNLFNRLGGAEKGASNSNAFEKWEKLSEETQDFLTNVAGIGQEEWDAKFKDQKGKDTQEYLISIIADSVYKKEQGKQVSEVGEGLTDSQKEEIQNYEDNINTYTIDELDKINKELRNKFGSEYSGINDIIQQASVSKIEPFVTLGEEGQITGGLFSNLFKNANIASQFAEAIQNGDFSTAQTLLVKKLGDDGQLLANILANVDEATISSINSFIADNFTGDEAQAKAQVGFQELLKKMTTGGIDLKDNELSILLNSGIDFSTNNPLSDDAIMKQAAEALQNASEGALSYEEALQKVNNVYPDLIQIIGEFQYGSESAFNTLLSGSQAAADELSKQSEVVLDIIDNYDYSTGLSREQVNQLAEVGLDYLYELEDETGTLQLNMSKATDLFAGDNEKTRKAFEKELGVERASVAILKDRLEQLKRNGASEEEIAKAQKELDSASASYNEHQKQYSQDMALRYQQTVSLLQQLINKVQELQDAADEAAEKVKDAQDAYNDALDAEKEAYDNISKTAQEADESIQDAKDSANEAYESWQDAIDAIGEAEEALAEANKELYEAIHGTEDYTTGLERMYNASRRIDTIDKRLENLKETMENATNSDDIVKATEDYINMAKEKVNVLTAMNQADQQTLNNMMNDFLNNSSYDALKQFFKQTENGIEIDMQGIENADANDEIKNAAIEWAEQYNEIFDNILDRNDEISEAQKIMEDYYKTALDGYVNLQEKVADILKENAEEEISITEEKYASMKEADDAYLDALESAINKQRELREQANKYEDLATQEKKLALLSRDTSGANQKQVLELQQEVETSRTEILDAEIDNFLESMRELYETQQEARDTEIEYLNALMESTNWWTKTNELLNSFESADDYKAWLMENDTSFGDMSVEQQEQYLMEAETDYNAIPQFDAAKIMMEQWGQDLSAMIQADVNEVNRIVNELGIDTAIGEQILTAGEVARDEMIRTAEEAVAEQQQAVIDAQQTALDMEQAYYESLDAIKKAEEQKIKDVNDAQDEYLKACEDRANKQKELSNALTAQEVANEELRRAQNELTAQQALANELKAQSSSIEAMYTTAEVALGIIQDIENREVNAQKAVFEIVDGNGNNLQGGMTYGAESIDEVIQMANEMGASIRDATNGRTYQIPSLLAYAQGGMVDYTGPAWVDGSKSKPEAFLDPEDTQNIAELTAVLSSRKSSSVPFAREMISAASSFGNILYPALNSIPTSSNISNISTTNNSTATSTNVEVHINVDSISSDYDVEQMLNVVEQRIYEVANPVGSSVILQK